MEEERTHSVTKSYLEAALTPITTPNISPYNSPTNIYVIRNQPKLGIIEKRLKWFTDIRRYKNNLNTKINNMYKDEFDYKNCDICKKALLEDECNSYYTVYVKRYKNIFDDYKVKIYNDRESCDSLIYCDKCMKNKNDEFKSLIDKVCPIDSINDKINIMPMPSLILT
jgi:hypothetical protein